MENQSPTQELINILTENQSFWANRLKEDLTDKWVVKVNICYTASFNKDEIVLTSIKDTVLLDTATADYIFKYGIFPTSNGEKRTAESMLMAKEFFTLQLEETINFINILKTPTT